MKNVFVLLLIACSLVSNAQVKNAFDNTFPTVNSLKAQSGTNNGIVTTLGIDSAADRIIQRWIWSDTSTLTADNKYIISLTSGAGGRWIKVTNQYFAVKRNINFMTTGNTPIDTTGPSYLGRLWLTEMAVNVTATTGTQVLAGTASIGTNSPNYNNIYSSLSLAGLTLNTGLVFSVTNSVPFIPAGTVIYFRSTAAPTGLTAATGDVYLSGWYTYK